MDNLGRTKEVVRAVIGEVLVVEPETVGDSLDFGRDLAVDSLTLTEIALRLETEFGIEIRDADYPTLTSVPAVAAYIEECRRRLLASTVSTT